MYPSEEDIQASIEEELGPEPNYASMLLIDAQSLKLSRNMKAVWIRLRYSPDVREAYADVLAEFQGERVPIEVTQADLKQVVRDQKPIEEIFSQFLKIDLGNKDGDLELRRNAAKNMLYDIITGLGPSKWSGEANIPSFMEYMFWVSIRRDVPTLSNEISRCIRYDNLTWSVPRNEAYERLLDLLVNYPQLRRRVFKFKERWNPDYENAQGSTYWVYET